jgi:hypothetical protein
MNQILNDPSNSSKFYNYIPKKRQKNYKWYDHMLFFLSYYFLFYINLEYTLVDLYINFLKNIYFTLN